MTAYAMVIIIAIICVTFLLYVRMEKKRTVRNRELLDVRTLAATAILALENVRKETDLQIRTDYVDLQVIRNLTTDALDDAAELQRKELTR